MLVLSIVIVAYAMILYSKTPAQASTDWTSIAQTVAGSLAYFFICGIIFWVLASSKTDNILAIILSWAFLGIVTAEFSMYLYHKDIFIAKWMSVWGYTILEFQTMIMILFVFLGIIMAMVKRK